ncbi:MAG TPA: TetR/AcrR family transcriptional regulator C-terminal domain-containing protein [Burkholderiaceae bacterium]|nr:TetR/AcrR family transcriptional regulator C-terminal domain-containing protein [Burkholderiaceae bacterium]
MSPLAQPASPAMPLIEISHSVVERALHAARTRFFDAGFDTDFMTRVAEDAGLQLSELARHFGNGHGLMRAVIEREADAIRIGLPLLPRSEAEYWQTVIAYGTNLLGLLNRPEVIALDRLLHAQAQRDDLLGAVFFECTYGRCLLEIAEMLAFGQAAGFIRDDTSAEQLAEMLLAAWEGMAFPRARLGVSPCPYPEPERWSTLCVHTLFRGQVW